MRILNVILTAVIVAAGLLGALLLVILGLVGFVLRRLFGRPAAMPRFQRPVRPVNGRPVPASREEVIDVVATEVKD